MSETLTNGVIVPDKGSRDWYADLRSNWLKLDSLMAGGNITINPAQTEGILVATITVGGKKYKLYQQDGDVSVKIDPSTENAEYPLVASTSAEANTGSVVMAPAVTVNPSTGAVTATSFKGKLEGSASTATTATKAVQDGAGAVIADTYATKEELGSKADDANVVHKSGTETIVGTKTFSDEVQTGTIRAVGGGANISLTPPDNGGFAIRAFNGTVSKELVGYPNGLLAWDNNKILTIVNGVTLDTAQTITGQKLFTDEVVIKSLSTDRVPSSDMWGNGITFQDSTGKRTGFFSNYFLANGDMFMRFFGSSTTYDAIELFSLKWSNNNTISGFLGGRGIITEENQIMLAKNLSGTNVASGGIVDCGTGNGTLKGWYINDSGVLALSGTLAVGKWKNVSIYPVGDKLSGMFLKVG